LVGTATITYWGFLEVGEKGMKGMKGILTLREKLKRRDVLLA
jgi:hypothetical protein